MMGICKYLKENLTFLILFFLAISIIEFACYEPGRQDEPNANLIEKEYAIEDVQLIGFQVNNGILVPNAVDPTILLRTDIPVKSITIRCANTALDSFGQVYYRSGDKFIEDESIKFHMSYPEITVEFPQVITGVIRLDLTNNTDDSLICQGFILNQEPTNTDVKTRFTIYSLVVICWVLGKVFISPFHKERLKRGFYRYALCIFSALLIVIDLFYTIQITYDSAHYLWLADVIKQGSWESWDLIRNIGFPLHIYLSQSILGYSTIALLIPMIIAHVSLFVMSYFILMEVFKPRHENTRLLIMTFLFLFIALDPTVVGYYHTLLTEYVAATIGIFSCFAAILLYKAPLFSKRFYFLTAYFLVMVPVAWHVKQPYIGATFFPFILVCLLILVQHFSKKIVRYVLVVNVSLAILVLGSTSIWNGFLKVNGNPMNEERRLSTYAENRIDNRASSFRDSPITSVKTLIKYYLEASNVVQLDENGGMVNFSLSRGYQNYLHAQRMYFFQDSLSNILLPDKTIQSNRFSLYTFYLLDHNSPPEWINYLFQIRCIPSNFLFTVTYLILPFYVIFQLIYWIKKKTPVNALLLIL
ncbi:MAG: hypothetical protein ABFD07_03405, partial [Methanobacterium sp.]